MPGGQGAGHCGLRGAVRPGISGSPSARHPPLLGRTGRGAQPGRSAAGWQSPSGSLLARGGAAAGAAPPARPRGGARLEGRAAQPAALVPWARAGARPSPGPRGWGSSGGGDAARHQRLPRVALAPGCKKSCEHSLEEGEQGDLPERVSPRKTAGVWDEGAGVRALRGPSDRWGLPRLEGSRVRTQALGTNTEEVLELIKAEIASSAGPA